VSQNRRIVVENGRVVDAVGAKRTANGKNVRKSCNENPQYVQCGTSP